MTVLPELMLLIGLCAPTVHPDTMLRIVQHESAMNPYAIGINGGYKLSRQPKTKEQAIAMAELLAKGGHNIDVGYTQVNIRTAKRLGVPLADLFDPCRNLQVGADVLRVNYLGASRRFGPGQQALNAAFSEYNTGNYKRGMSNGYVASIHKQRGITK